ncbi:hypothetical protein OQA88_11867 [Cercophora sp. LCS_1]
MIKAAATPSDVAPAAKVKESNDDLPDLPIVDGISWMGPVVLGGPNVTLFGTAESIYNQIIKLNPKYDVWDIPYYVEQMAARNITRESQEKALQTRQSVIKTCTYTPSLFLQWDQCSEGWYYLNSLGGYCWAGPWSCARVSCSHACGMFLCSRTNTGGWGSCALVADDMWWIWNACNSVKGQGHWIYSGHSTELKFNIS